MEVKHIYVCGGAVVGFSTPELRGQSVDGFSTPELKVQ